MASVVCSLFLPKLRHNSDKQTGWKRLIFSPQNHNLCMRPQPGIFNLWLVIKSSLHRTRYLISHSSTSRSMKHSYSNSLIFSWWELDRNFLLGAHLLHKLPLSFQLAITDRCRVMWQFMITNEISPHHPQRPLTLKLNIFFLTCI